MRKFISFLAGVLALLILASCESPMPGLTENGVNIGIVNEVPDADIVVVHLKTSGVTREIIFSAEEIANGDYKPVSVLNDGRIETGPYEVEVFGYMDTISDDTVVSYDHYTSIVTYDVRRMVYNVRSKLDYLGGEFLIGIKLPLTIIYGYEPEDLNFQITLDGEVIAESGNGVTVTEYTRDESGMSGGTVTIAVPKAGVGRHELKVYVENESVGESRVGLDSFTCKRGESVYRWLDLSYSSNTETNWSCSVEDLVGGIIKLEVDPVYRKDVYGYFLAVPETNIISLSGFTTYVTTLRIDWYVDGRILDPESDYTVTESGNVDDGTLKYIYRFRPGLCEEGYRCMTVVFYDTATLMAAGTSNAMLRFERGVMGQN